MTTPGKLDGRTALITGGGSGIGAASAELFAAEGATVYAADISAAVVDRWADHPRIHGVQLDVADSAAVDAVLERVTAEQGTLHVLLNGAGTNSAAAPSGNPPTFLTATTDEDFDRVVRINLAGPFYTLRAALPLLVAAEGASVINTASVAALIGAAMSPAYPASKAGLLGMTRAAAIELAPFGVRVNAVAPGSVDTPMLRAAGPELVKELVAMQPIARAATPEEIARTMLFLAGDDSAYYTGQTFAPAGGLHM